MSCTHDATPPSRSTFLRAAAVATTAAAVPRALAAQPAQGNIDVHQHMVPPFYLDALKANGRMDDIGDDPNVLGWTPELSLTRMDNLGIQKAYITLSNPGAQLGAQSAWARLARRCNEHAADLSRSHPGRFGSFATLPMPDVQSCLKEVAYAMDVLHADGVGLLSVYGDKWLGDVSFFPLYEELNRRKAIAFVHPAVGTCCRTLIPNVGFPVIEYPIDTTRAIVSLLVGGAFARFPDIRFIFSHGGGTLPMLADRIVRQTMFRKDLTFTESPAALLKRQYYDVALSFSRPTLSAILAFAEPSHVLFGSDFPYVEMKYTTEGLRQAGLPTDQLAAIQRSNALAILPRTST